MARKQNRKSRSPRQSKKIIYFIVEGCTEENYLKLLKMLFQQDAVIKNCHGGSAKKVLTEAQKIIDQNKDEYLFYVIWFDCDTYNPSSDHNLLNSLKSNPKVNFFMSKPCIENWLLAHFQKINLEEPKCKKCEEKLKKYIPQYEKNDCNLLTKYIQEKQINTAIANYPELGKIPQLFIETKANK